MLTKIGLPLATAAILSACVSNPSNIEAIYVNHAQYQSMECEEVQAELTRVSAKEADFSDRQHQNFVTDTALLTVGLVVFWPALLLMPATTDRKHEIAQMRGEKEALERAVARQCAARVAAATPRIVGSGAMPVVASAAMIPVGTTVTSAGGPGVAVRPGTWAFTCPAKNTTVSLSSGETVLWDGADPTDPLVCISQINGVTSRRLFGIFDTSTTDIASHRLGLTRIFSLNGGGVSAASHYTVVEGIPNAVQFTEDWRVVGFEPVTVAAGEYQAMLVERRRARGSQMNTQRLWVDTATGVIVRNTIENGMGAVRNSEVIRLDQPRT